MAELLLSFPLAVKLEYILCLFSVCHYQAGQIEKGESGCMSFHVSRLFSGISVQPGLDDGSDVGRAMMGPTQCVLSDCPI